MDGSSARGVDGTSAVVLVPMHLVAGALVLGLKLAWPVDGAVFAQIALRTRQLHLAWYSRQNPPTHLEEY